MLELLGGIIATGSGVKQWYKNTSYDIDRKERAERDGDIFYANSKGDLYFTKTGRRVGYWRFKSGYALYDYYSGGIVYKSEYLKDEDIYMKYLPEVHRPGWERYKPITEEESEKNKKTMIIVTFIAIIAWIFIFLDYFSK